MITVRSHTRSLEDFTPTSLLAEAGPLFRESLDGHRRVLGDAHPNTRTAVQLWAHFEKAKAVAAKRKYT
jgi:hypothetical protein